MVVELLTNKYLLNSNDFEKYYELFLYSFNMSQDDDREYFLKQEFAKSDVYGIKEHDQLMASVTAVPFKVNFFGVTYSMSGIANVMSAPEYVPNTGISTLMAQAFEDMHDNKVTLSYLGPFSYDYYRRFGYEQVFESLKITIPFEKFARHDVPKTGYLKRFNYSKAPELIGDLFAKYNNLGTVIREDWWWKLIPHWSPKHLLAVSYNENDQVDGYLRYSFVDNNFVIHEMLYQNSNAFLHLMHFINKHRSIYQQVVVNMSDPTFKVNALVSNPSDAKVTVQPSMMARIVDLKHFIVEYPFPDESIEPVNIRVKDSLEWNDHVWNLSLKSGIVTFELADDEQPDLTMSIQTLTQALFGYQSLEDLALTGDIKGDPEIAKSLDKCWVRKNAQLNDFF